MTDVDGVRDADGRRLDTLTAGEAETLIDSGVIAGGMVPKIRAALAALAWDGAEAIIADSSADDALDRALERPDLRDPDHRRSAGGRGGLTAGPARGDERRRRDRDGRRDDGSAPALAPPRSATASGRSARSSRTSRSAARGSSPTG